jgi:hypothetical protein
VEAKIPSMQDVAQAMPSVADVKNAVPSMEDMRSAMPSMDDVKKAMPSMESMRRRLPDMEYITDRLPSQDQLRSYGSDLMRPEVMGGAAVVAAAFFLPAIWRIPAGIVGGALIGYGLFADHGSRYPSETRGRDHYSTYGSKRVRSREQDDDLIDSMSMDSFPTSDPPGTY